MWWSLREQTPTEESRVVLVQGAPAPEGHGLSLCSLWFMGVRTASGKEEGGISGLKHVNSEP